MVLENGSHAMLIRIVLKARPAAGTPHKMHRTYTNSCRLLQPLRTRMFKMQILSQSLDHFSERQSVEKSMMQKMCFFLLLLFVLLAGCTPLSRDPNVSALPAANDVPSPDSQLPVTGGEPATRGDVVIDSLAIQASDSFPPQYQLIAKGSLPTSCHQLRTEVENPNMQSEIHVEIFSVYDPYTVCAQAAKPFGTSIPLGGYVRGSYTVFVNEKEVGEITP